MPIDCPNSASDCATCALAPGCRLAIAALLRFGDGGRKRFEPLQIALIGVEKALQTGVHPFAMSLLTFAHIRVHSITQNIQIGKREESGAPDWQRVSPDAHELVHC